MRHVAGADRHGPACGQKFRHQEFRENDRVPCADGYRPTGSYLPAHTNMSSYNLITTPKELHIYPECGHTVDYNDWNPRRAAFFEKWK